MTANISQPFIRVSDSNGNPIVGATLAVYLVGTTTLASIYSDEALTVSVTNPLSGVNASDASGSFPRVYLAAGTYKLRAQASDDTLIWEYDNIDTGLGFSGGPLSIASGGTASTTAASARTALGAASQTSVDTLSTEVTSLSSSISSLVSFPQGRLTLSTATPVIAADVTAATSVYYTPYTGNTIPIYDGVQFNVNTFAELTLSLASQHTANNIFDVFVFKDSGNVTIGTGPAWSVSTAGSGARGTGAGTTELVRTNGLWTNANSMTARNGSTTYTVAAHLGTYVGSIYIDATNGQVSCHVSYGQNRKFGVWNAFNRVPIIVKAGDSTSNWPYNSATIRASNNAPSSWSSNVFNVGSGSAANGITTLNGLPESEVDAVFFQIVTTGATSTGTYGVGINSTTVMSGFTGASGAAGSAPVNVMGRYIISIPPFGLTTVCSLEKGNATSTATINGGESSMLLTAEWRG